VTGYAEHGISVQVGHEVMIHETWVCPWMGNGQRPWSAFNGTIPNATSGILLWGADHYLSNVIIFMDRSSNLVGVEVAGGGNLLAGVHAYQGPIGIYICYGEEWPRESAIGQAHNRVVDSYMDGNLLAVRVATLRPCDPYPQCVPIDLRADLFECLTRVPVCVLVLSVVVRSCATRRCSWSRTPTSSPADTSPSRPPPSSTL
jgi:hypothetical protein